MGKKQELNKVVQEHDKSYVAVRKSYKIGAIVLASLLGVGCITFGTLYGVTAAQSQQRASREEELTKEIEAKSQELATAQKELEEKTKEVEEKDREIAAKEAEIEAKSEEVERLQSEVATLTEEKAKLEADVKAKQAEIDKLNNELSAQKAEYEAQIAQLKADHQAEIAKLEAEHQAAIDKLNKEHEEAVAALETYYKQKIEEAEAAGQAAVEETKKEYQALLDDQKTKYEAQIAQLNKDHQAEIDKLNAEHQQEIENLNVEHQKAINEKQAEIDALLVIKANLESELNSANEKIKELNTTIEAQDSEIKTLKGEKEKLENDLKIAQNEIVGLNDQVSKLTQEKAVLEAQLLEEQNKVVVTFIDKKGNWKACEKVVSGKTFKESEISLPDVTSGYQWQDDSSAEFTVDSQVTKSCLIYETNLCSIAFDQTSLIMVEGETVTLNATFGVGITDPSKVVWSVDDEKYLSAPVVSEDKTSATITSLTRDYTAKHSVTCSYGSFSSTCDVYIYPEEYKKISVKFDSETDTFLAKNDVTINDISLTSNDKKVKVTYTCKGKYDVLTHLQLYKDTTLVMDFGDVTFTQGTEKFETTIGTLTHAMWTTLSDGDVLTIKFVDTILVQTGDKLNEQLESSGISIEHSYKYVTDLSNTVTLNYDSTGAKDDLELSLGLYNSGYELIQKLGKIKFLKGQETATISFTVSDETFEAVTAGEILTIEVVEEKKVNVEASDDIKKYLGEKGVEFATSSGIISDESKSVTFTYTSVYAESDITLTLGLYDSTDTLLETLGEFTFETGKIKGEEGSINFTVSDKVYEAISSGQTLFVKAIFKNVTIDYSKFEHDNIKITNDDPTNVTEESSEFTIYTSNTHSSAISLDIGLFDNDDNLLIDFGNQTFTSGEGKVVLNVTDWTGITGKGETLYIKEKQVTPVTKTIALNDGISITDLSISDMTSSISESSPTISITYENEAATATTVTLSLYSDDGSTFIADIGQFTFILGGETTSSISFTDWDSVVNGGIYVVKVKEAKNNLGR